MTRLISLAAALMLAFTVALPGKADDLLALIWATEDYENNALDTPGAIDAAEDMRKTLAEFGFNIRTYKDKSGERLKDSLVWLENETFAEQNGAFVWVAVYGRGAVQGGKNIVIGADGERIQVDWIIEQVSLGRTRGVIVTLHGPAGASGWNEPNAAAGNVIAVSPGFNYSQILSRELRTRGAGEPVDNIIRDAAVLTAVETEASEIPEVDGALLEALTLPTRDEALGSASDTRSLGATASTGGVFNTRFTREVAPIQFKPHELTREGETSIVRLLFGTNRRPVETASVNVETGEDTTSVVFSNDFAAEVTYGALGVTVPTGRHALGGIERPCHSAICIFNRAEDPARHFTIAEASALDDADFRRLASILSNNAETFDGHAIVYIHGFANTFEDAAFRTAQIVHDLDFDSEAYFFSWPSQGKISRRHYDRDEDSVDASFLALKSFLTRVRETSSARQVHVIAHSMGSQITLKALQAINAERGDDDPMFGELILAAPDVNRSVFISLANEIKDLARGVTVYASSTDKAMKISRGFNGDRLRAGDITERDGPIFVPGVQTIDVSALSTDAFYAINHSTYADAREVLDDISRLVRVGTRPPHERTRPRIQQIGTQNPIYWEYQ